MRTVLWCASVCVGLSLAAAEAAKPATDIHLQPPPKQVEMGAQFAPLPQEVTIETPAQSAPAVRHAASLLADELTRRFGRRVVVSPAGKDRPGAAISLTVDPAVHLPPEGYVLRIEQRAGAAAARIAGADPSGALYGTFTLLSLLEQSEGARLPCPTTIRDWPTLSTRAFTGFVRDLSDASRRRLDWFARWRLNAGYYEIYGDRGQDRVPEIVSNLAREARARGITLYGCVSNWRTDRFLKRPLCPSNPKDVALVERLFDEFARRGCGGLIFLFDDLRPNSVTHPQTCDACRRRFGDLAGAQAFWVELMARVARRHGVRKLLICPTPYYRAWRNSYGGKLDGVAYYRRLGPVCERLGVQMFFCPYRSRAVADVTAAGLRNFVWWYNGVYPFERAAGRGRVDSAAWSGFAQLEFGWYNTRWDSRRGLVVEQDVWDALRTLPARTRHAWLCAGGDVTWALWGTYAWSPEQLDATAARRAAIEAVFGAGAAEPYERWEAIVRKWKTAFACGAHAARWRDPARRGALLAELARDIETANQALKQLGRAKRALTDAEEVEARRRRMADSVAWLRAKLAQGRTGTAQARLFPMSRRPEGNAVRWEQKMTLSNFGVRYVLRYAIAQEAGRWHRCRWHFGSGLGMMAPSLRNWYDAGFIDVVVDGRSLDQVKATFARDGEALRGRWDGDAATVELRFTLRPDNGLAVRGKVRPKTTLKGADVKLWCIPGAGWGAWKDMDKWITTPKRNVQHTRRVRLDLAREPWVIYYDKTYDVPHQHAEGPCGLLVDPTAFDRVEIDLGRYVVTTTLRLRRDATAFRLVVWDFHGAKNADVIRAWRANPPRWGP